MITANEARAMTSAAHVNRKILAEAEESIRYAANRGETHCLVNMPRSFPKTVRRTVIATLKAQGFTVKHRWYNLSTTANYLGVSW